ncbi:hypothetical protein NC653_039756 [Populus alba x Populus x berolinensis]|uniref:Uncharacterized protein n=1 Tax=Populus alba x Populus x berolinensis TaxID=444605 RepID=A0AAD6LBZ6_9ROSI|nr:hypothetical protein NC653_039756 [Populus alba x Populus x berolinensis]
MVDVVGESVWENDVLVLGELAGPRLSWSDRRVCENDRGAGALIVPMRFCSAVWPMIHDVVSCSSSSFKPVAVAAVKEAERCSSNGRPLASVMAALMVVYPQPTARYHP